MFKPGREALISCNDDGSDWTLGGYVRSTHTSEKKVVIGVGYMSNSEESSKVVWILVLILIVIMSWCKVF